MGLDVNVFYQLSLCIILVKLFVYGRPSGSAGSCGSCGSAFCFPYNSVTVRRILFKFGRFRQQPWEIFLNMLQ